MKVISVQLANGYGCNMIFIGTTYFYKNSAYYDGGGALMSSDSNIIFSGTAYFEGNVVANKGGGAIALANSKLIFKPNLNVFFISNYANEKLRWCTLYRRFSMFFGIICTIRMFHYHR